MQNTHVRTPRPAKSLSVIQPAKIVPTTAASSKAMIIMPPFDTGMPLYSFRKVGPQSRNPKRTTYTKKFASAQSQITRLRKTSRRRSASVTWRFSAASAFPRTSERSSSGSPASWGPSLTEKKQNTAARPASAAGT